MQDTKNSATAILAFNFFDLIGLGSLDENSKNELLIQITQVILRHFLETKITDKLTEDEAKKVVDKYKDIQPNQVNDFLSELTGLIPNAEDLFLEATVEIKTDLVKKHYDTRKKELTKLLAGETDQEKVKVITDQVAVCDKKLEYISQGRWELLAALELI